MRVPLAALALSYTEAKVLDPVPVEVTKTLQTVPGLALTTVLPAVVAGTSVYPLAVRVVKAAAMVASQIWRQEAPVFRRGRNAASVGQSVRLVCEQTM